MSMENINIRFGRRIKELRLMQNVSQEELGFRCQLSKNYVSDVERGKSSIRLSKLVAVMNALECSADEIFADVIKCGYKVKVSRLSEQMEALSEEDREKVYTIIDAFI